VTCDGKPDIWILFVKTYGLTTFVTATATNSTNFAGTVNYTGTMADNCVYLEPNTIWLQSEVVTDPTSHDNTAPTITGQKTTYTTDQTTVVSGGNCTLVWDSTNQTVTKQGVFTVGPSLLVPRQNHTATLLLDGRVLIAGGEVPTTQYSVYANNNVIVNAATAQVELYDPLIGLFKTTGSMNAARVGHTATLLPNGKVLIAGGNNADLGQSTSTTTIVSAELYDPASGTFATTGSMISARNHHMATLLSNGKVLIAGGDSNGGIYGSIPLPVAELYDPATGLFTATGSFNTPGGRGDDPATLLPNGKVLFASGEAELYDPVAGTFTYTGYVYASSLIRSATLLLSGQVLLTGNIQNDHVFCQAELYDPVAGTFTCTAQTGDLINSGAGNVSVPGNSGTGAAYLATLLSNGNVLIVGGFSGSYPIPSSATELYNPPAGEFVASGDMVTGRVYHTATLLTNGKVLIAGGYDGWRIIGSTELYE
jgi:hypothetical protein